MMENTVKNLPTTPGVYLFKDNDGVVLYVGKAKNLRSRVKNYFQKNNDLKTEAMVAASTTLDHIVTNNEIAAMLLEARLIKELQPQYNILLKTGQPFSYILFTKGALPQIKIVRNKKESGTYFGPFMEATLVRRVYNFLLRILQLKICNKKIENGCLYYHIGRCAGSCKSDFDKSAYLERLSLAKKFLQQGHKKFLTFLQEKIAEQNELLNFEKSKELNEYVVAFTRLFEYIDTIPKRPQQKVTLALQKFLQLDFVPHTIDCFDISHSQGHEIVGACIRFVDGVPDKNNFRKFKLKTVKQNDDYASLVEIVSRRYKNQKNLPDLVLIDGGKGQRNAIVSLSLPVTCIALAKREETIFSEKFPEGKGLSLHNDAGKMLIALRDYAHHFAVSYHRVRRVLALRDDHQSSF